jgi:surface antigen
MFRPFKSARFMISVAAASMSSVLAGCGGGGGGGGALVASAPVPASSKSSPASIPAPAAVYKQPSNTFYEYAGSFISEGLASRMQIAGSRDADGKFTGTSLDVTLDEVKDRAFVTTSINNNQ